MPVPDFRVDPRLIEQYVEELGTIGALPEGGLFRPVYSPAWLEARERLAAWMRAAGLHVRGDAVGNLFGRLEAEADGPVVLTGSHFDTVKQGGKFDGALGVLAGLVALRLLRERAGRPRRPLEVVALCEEEGSRFHATFWGSRAILGLIRPEEVHELRDADGLTIGAAMQSVGLDPGGIPTARRDDLAEFIELHVEQGRILYDEGVDVGVVETITGLRWYGVEVLGRVDHAGATPMDLRRDAMVGAAEMIAGITSVAEAMGRPAVATCGTLLVEPGAVNIVPGRVRFTVDARHPDPTGKTELVAQIEAVCREVAGRRGLEVRFETLQDVPPVRLDPGLVALLEDAARERGASWKRMVSGAGHDAQMLARQLRVAMLFVPSREGRSHSPAEYTAPAQAARGIEVLMAALYRLAYAQHG